MDIKEITQSLHKLALKNFLYIFSWALLIFLQILLIHFVYDNIEEKDYNAQHTL